MTYLAAFFQRLYLRCGRKRCVMVAVLRDRDQAGGPIRRHEQRLGARPEHAVSSLQLRAVYGEVRLMDELVRVGAVLREAGDADRNGCPDRLARGLDVEGALSDGTADPLRDLHCLIGRRLRQE